MFRTNKQTNKQTKRDADSNTFN